MSVLENVKVGHIFGHNRSFIDDQKLMDILDFVGLSKKRYVIAEKLTIFELKLLMIASALATRPELILLDEPVGGLNKEESDYMVRLIHQINKQGITVVLVEHILDVLCEVSDRIMILSDSKKIALGKPSEVIANPEVVRAYLGTRYRQTYDGVCHA